MNKYSQIIVFSDFDGTIVKKDIGDELFRVFGEFEPYHSQLRSGDLEISHYWNIVCSKLKDGITEQEIVDFSLGQEYDNNFSTFLSFLRSNNIDLFIISDGFDVYIDPIVGQFDLDHKYVLSNKMIFEENSKPKPVFPRASESCDCMVASCKRNAILDNSEDDDIIVYIGDGYSDYCAAEHSDVIFAKKELAAYCNEHRIPHYPFNTFFDVYKLLSDALKKGKLKQRHQAKLLRKKAFEIE
jgi:2-hydroxy-3-keto-5-methylthiopentenyl-1-phosphate phosphatase